MSRLIKAIYSRSGELVTANHIGVGRNGNYRHWLNYIETNYGIYTLDEEHINIFFMPHKQYIGSQFPFSIKIDEDATLQTILEDYFDLNEDDIVRIDIYGNLAHNTRHDICT